MKTVERENFVEFTRKYFALRTILKKIIHNICHSKKNLKLKRLVLIYNIKWIKVRIRIQLPIVYYYNTFSTQQIWLSSSTPGSGWDQRF